MLMDLFMNLVKIQETQVVHVNYRVLSNCKSECRTS